MKEQKQERPGTWRLLIGSVLIFCAQVGLVTADDLSYSLSDAIGYEGASPDQQRTLLVRFVDREGPPVSCPDLVGPRTARSLRETLAGRIVRGACVEQHYDRLVGGLSLVKLPEGGNLANAMVEFMACEDVRYAEPNYQYQLCRTPNDPNFGEQWALNNTGQTGGLEDADIDAPEAWDIQTGSKDVLIAVLDTGIDTSHPDLVVNLWMNSVEMFGEPDVDDDDNGAADDFFGYDFVNDSADPIDDVYHGTYVAGIIGAFTNNAMGIAGVNWSTSLIAVKVADRDGVNLDAAIAGVQYAVASGARIINASWGGPDYSQGLKDAIEEAGKQGVLFVAAAGNDSSDNDDFPVYPASYDSYNIISVLATNADDRLALSSNYGRVSVDIAEPGEEVLSTMPMEETGPMAEAGLSTEYGTLSGSSVAAPHVSGVCALLWSQFPSLSYHHVKHAVMQTTDKVVAGLCLSHGRVNAAKALNAVPQGQSGRVLNTRDAAAFYPSIQAAIDDANDGDVIIAEGKPDGNIVYKEHIDFQGKAILLRSGSVEDPTDPNVYPETTFLLGLAEEGSIVTFANGEGPQSTLAGFTIGWGVAEYGAGIRCEDASPTIRLCIISNNQALYYGAGIDCLGGSPEITNCVISDNRAFGKSAIGGGINAEDSSPVITDCIIRDNSSLSVGGGVGCYNASPTLSNCFITNNSAAFGSGQFDLEASSPTITNCTIVVDQYNPAKDGGIWCLQGSDPTITNCIIWGNGDDLLDCSATYSCVEDQDDAGEGIIHADPQFVRGPRGRYYLSQVAAGQLSGSPCADAGDPDTDASLVARMQTLTTRTDGLVDTGTVDMGAHYGAVPAEYFQLNVTTVDASGAPIDPNEAGGYVDPNGGSFRQYEVVQLTAYVEEGYRIKRWIGTEDDATTDPNIMLTVVGPTDIMIEFEKIPLYRLRTTVAGGHGMVDPSHRRGELYPDGTVVTLVASPEKTYIVDRWEGTDDDTSWANANTVTVDGDKEVTVSFREPKSLYVPAQYRSISQAIEAASDHGDKIIAGAETYTTHSLDFGGKAITLASEHPDDPCCVAATVIDCAQLGRAFIFQSGEGPDAVIDGFTIRNGSAVYDPCTPTDSGGTGTDGDDAFGGAVACFNGSSPTLSNLVIENCIARGRDGEDGSFVFDPYPAPAPAPDPLDPLDPLDPPDPLDPNDPNAPADPNEAAPGVAGEAGEDGAAGADGAAGLDGADGYPGGRGGHGYGGALYFEAGSSPTILNCTIAGCRALGGNGGVGGQGQDGQDGQDGQGGQPGQEGQPGGEGLNDGPLGPGGAGGAGGDGGAGGQGGGGGRGGDGGEGGEALGGAIYFGPDCRPTIKYCTILNSTIRQGLGDGAGAGGGGGSGGTAGIGADPGAGGEGEPAGADGAAGVDGMGGNGGAGNAGGNMGRNGARSWGGAIFFGDDCEIEISDTAISFSSALSIVPTVAYVGGDGGSGGAGGDAGGVGGNAGAGGEGGPSGGAGTPGDGGDQGWAGEPGEAGAAATSVTTNFGGAIAYRPGCTVKLTNCTISSNMVEAGSGGGEHYSEGCTTELIRCSITDNIAALNGGGQSFDPSCSATAVQSGYMSNVGGGDGGGLYAWYDCEIDVNDTMFAGNRATGSLSSGGGLYGGGAWDDQRKEWYNGGTVNARNSYFLYNVSAFGGGLYWYGLEAEIDVVNCVIQNNTAQHGGGLYWSGGAPTISDCSIRDNTANGPQQTVLVPPSVPDPFDPTTWPIPFDPNSLTDPNNWPDPNDPNSIYDPTAYPPIQTFVDTDCGGGGGLVCWSSDALIENCFIGQNISRGSGGGVYFGGDPFTPMLKNCLVKGNSAIIDGGGILSHWFAAPTIANCTIVENSVSDLNVANRGKGGGLSCSHESDTTLINSILWNNTGQQGDQIAIGSESDPRYMQRPATLTVSYSDIQAGQAGIHLEQGRTLNWLDGNIEDDPLFVASYYLSQVAADQDANSPCVDAGSTPAAMLGLDRYTTRTDEIGDAGTVDMGFHYPGQGRYQLIVQVIGGHGTVEPIAGFYHEFAEVTLTAHPDPGAPGQPGYRVKQWIGTDSDPSWNQNVNTVTMDTGDKFVTVEFEEDKMRNILVPAEFATIEEAVSAASPGDTNIILSEGIHYIANPDGIDVQRKSIRIMSTDPNDPNIVAHTIIDCAGSRFVRKRAFHFRRGETGDCVVTGITIRNGYWIGTVGLTGGGEPMHPVNIEFGIDDQDPPFRMPGGEDVNGVGYGGAILCENGSSPTFTNCVIENCMVVAAQGGNGIDGYAIGQGSDVDGFWGGDAGFGNGDSYGGAIACLSGSRPTFINCVIRNCTARGGMGGDGGNGSNPNDGSGRESWGGDAGDAIGDGHGGAVYCADGSDAVFERCVFANNLATTGTVGVPGGDGPGAALSDPYPNPAGPGANAGVATNGTIVGGAVHQDNASPKFMDCRFAENNAYAAFSFVSAIGLAEAQEDEVRVYRPGGAIYSGPGNTVFLQGCRFTHNVSGAVHAAGNCVVDANECVFSRNEAPPSIGAGVEIYFTPVFVDGQYVEPNIVGTAEEGGALYVGPSCPEVKLQKCDFQSNTAYGRGGAIRLMSHADIVGCAFSGNHTGESGGAIEGHYQTRDPNIPFILQLDLTRCTFGGNEATDGFYGQGGALHFKDFNAVITDCYFLSNKAKNGGGLFLTAGNVTLTGGAISGNVSTGEGGVAPPLDMALVSTNIDLFGDLGLSAIYDIYYMNRGNFVRTVTRGTGVDIGGGLVCAATDARIEDCSFAYNTAGGLKGAGGAISFYSGYKDHVVKNCLFTGNSAEREGGAIACVLATTPVVTNSTFAGNSATRLGGAIFCDGDSDVTVGDCIFEENTKHAVGEENAANSIVQHSLFYENPDGDFGVYDTVTSEMRTLAAADLDVTNTDADPLFVEGPLGQYYLSQAQAGQETDSPAVDAGSDFASELNLAGLTTRTDGAGDSGVVDLGYHFPDHTDLPKYTLTAEVVGGHGTISPTGGTFYAGTAVPLKATPEAGWRVGRWSGTGDDASTKTDNIVVMGPDRYVALEFEQPRTIVVGSDADYTSIQHAIDAAEDGDVVIIPTGTYEAASSGEYPWNIIRIHDKNITLTGSNPDDPGVVAATMLRRYIFEIRDVGPETVIDGLTIGDVNWVAADGDNGADIDGGNHDGEPGSPWWGGTMIVYGASPTIRNCRFVDCSITGGDGGEGDGGWQDVHPVGYDGGYAGSAYGAAVYIGFQSSPTFENCLFQNCRVYGGNGGNGGSGVQGANGGRGGNWMLAEAIEETIRLWWDGWEWGPFDKDGNLRLTIGGGRGYFDKYWKYSGYGGAVYMEYYSSPRFVDCNFTDNHAYGGLCGIGGSPPSGSPLPDRQLNIENFGGAVYMGLACDPVFEGCVFSKNSADSNAVDVPDDIYVSYGGAIAIEDDCRPTFIRCTIEDSNSCLGGGMYWTRSSPTIIDCNFADNAAYHGGGMYAVDSTGLISGTSVSRNLAFTARIDPNAVSDPNIGFVGIASEGGGYCGIASPIEIRDSQFRGNRAITSGGAIYLAGSDQDVNVAPVLHNCLIEGNSAGRDGGGISANRYLEPIISNCTIVDNIVTAASEEAFGGGLYVSYDSNAVMTDSILWDNVSSYEGAQIAVAHGHPYGAGPSTLQLSHSDVQPSLDPNAPAVTALDLVLAFDSTESMLDDLDAVQQAATELVGLVTSAVPDYRIAVVDFKDFNDTFGTATDYPYRVVTPFTDDAGRVVSGINAIQTPAGSGGDVPDSVFFALMRAIDGNDLGGWRGGETNRAILLIGDAPPHDPETPTGYTLADVLGAAAQQPNKRIFCVQMGVDVATSAYFHSLAAGGGGARVQAVDVNEVVPAVIEGLRLITQVGWSIFVSEGSRLPGWNATTELWDPNTANIGIDPLFIAGYYLSQTGAGQGLQSPAVDAGSGRADAPSIALHGRATRTDGVYDEGPVDMGYHYAEGVTLYTLRANVLPDANDGLRHGSVSPSFWLVYEGSADNVIQIEAEPDDGWKVQAWTGTDDDTLTGTVNLVTLTEDRDVTVTFEKRRPRVVTVPGDFPRIQDAVTAGEDGDTIVVDPGTYYSGYESIGLIMDKSLTVTSRNPDDPCTVAATIIDGLGAGAGGSPWTYLGVVFTGDTDSRTVLNGFTIQNCGGIAVSGGDGDRGIGHPNGEDGAPIQGAAMILLPGASPVIKNCVLRNNRVIAGSGGTGIAADATQNAGRGGWGGWARGGAVYCATDTGPTFINCIIENNFAEGGNGGNGGVWSDGGGSANYGGNYTPPFPIDYDPDRLGPEVVDEPLWQIWQWDYAMALEQTFGAQSPSIDSAGAPVGGGSYVGDYRWYSAYGGGVYVDQRSTAEFVECTIRGNRTYGGMSGQGGAGQAGRFVEPLVPFEMPTYGGGVYVAADSTVTFTSCTFSDNIATPTLAGQDPNFRLDPYIGYGGGVAAEGTASVLFQDCNFVDNFADTGGGLYIAQSNATVIDCNLVSNTALRGGGLNGFGGLINIAGCNVKNNAATTDVNDPNDDDILAIGGGILCSSTSAQIQDCNVTGNRSDGSGGGFYLRGENGTVIANCLVRNNVASRDGGGVSTNWYATPTLRNCTFVGNAAPGTIGEPNDTGLGGAVFCGYLSECDIVDTIFWQNLALRGSELAVGSGFRLDPLCGKLEIAYSDIMPGPNDVWVDDGCTLVKVKDDQDRDTNLYKDPMFVDGPLGDFYLSNPLAGQARRSPCVDTGSDQAANVGMSRYTTRTDRVPDTGVVDIGFHYPFLEPCRFCDLVFDGIVRFDDFVMFALKWRDEGCSEANGWCDGADFTFSSEVDARDLIVLADCWLVEDTTPPVPNPSEWETEPHLVGGNAAEMVAEEAFDAWGWDVEYFFDCVLGDCDDSGWQRSRAYHDGGLRSGREYGYRVKARDALGNETKLSVTRYVGEVDTTPPAPAPYVLVIDPNSSQTITMTALTSFDKNGVQYYFEADPNTPGAHDSNWVDAPVYTDTFLVPNTTYCYRVRARDLSAAQNETEWSEWSCATTQTPADLTPPTPDPMAFDPNGLPREFQSGTAWNEYSIEMAATPATDDGGGAVLYYFECRDYPEDYPDGFSSGWIPDTTWTVLVGRQGQGLRFRVKARDEFGNETEWSELQAGIARPEQAALNTGGAGAGGGVGGGGALGGG